jgi:hypothetical protein
VGGRSERYHFYSGRRSFIGSEGSQAVYYLSSRHVRLKAIEKKVRCQEMDFFGNAEGYRI